MPGTGAGWDSCMYRIFLVGGLIAIIAGVVVTVALTPDDSYLPVQVGVAGMGLFIALLVGYWAYQIIFKGYGSPKVVESGEQLDIDDPGVLASWNKLFAAMTVHGGDPQRLKEMEKQGRASLATWFGWTAVIALGPIVLMVPYLMGWMDWSLIRYGVIVYLGLVVFMVFITGTLAGRSAEAGEAIYLAPLGLKITGLPEVGLRPGAGGVRPAVRGASVIEGERSGRAVRIELNGWRVMTQVAAPSPVFHIKSRDGKLEALRSTAAVDRALEPLRQAKRWAGLEVRGDANGITATRNSRGVNMWLYDVWLIERVLKEIAAGN